MKGAIIRVLANHVSDWRPIICLRAQVIKEIEEIAGPTPDARFIHLESDIKLIEDTETWAWFPQRINDENIIGLWFRDTLHATYFKLKWGGL